MIYPGRKELRKQFKEWAPRPAQLGASRGTFPSAAGKRRTHPHATALNVEELSTF